MRLGDGMAQAQIVDATNFCLFMPPNPLEQNREEPFDDGDSALG